MAKIAQQCKGGTLHLVNMPPKYKVLVAKTAEKSFEKAGKLFVYQKPVEVFIFPKLSQLVIPETGMGAVTTEINTIWISIDFSRRNIVKIIKEQLPSTIYHELSHVMRDLGEYQTLLESFILEGIACYIERQVFKKRILWIEPIHSEMQHWRQAQKLFGKRKYSFQERHEWYFGTTKKLPRWIGYRLGYLLVEGYMKNNPKTSFEQLVRLKAKTILQGSGL